MIVFRMMIEGFDVSPFAASSAAIQLRGVLDVLAGLLPVHGLHVPAVRLVALRDVLGECDVRVVLDGDLVRVVDHHEVAELLVAGERGRLAGDALLQVAVARR